MPLRFVRDGCDSPGAHVAWNRPGDEVICPAFTFFATAGCIARTGAKPVFVDSCPFGFNLDVRGVAAKVTTKTKAIIPVHLFGQAAEMDAVTAIARAHGLSIIEDAAQSLGAEYRGRKAGGIGAFGAFSFFPTKNLGGFGDAGMVVTNDDALAERARLLRTHGAKQRYFHESVGANFRLDAVQAALLGVKLGHYASYTEKRRANAAQYTEQLGALPGVELVNVAASCCVTEPRSDSNGFTANFPPIQPGIILPAASPTKAHLNQYTIRVLGLASGRSETVFS